MPVPSPRNKILPARGNFSDLSTNVASLSDGEICYAIDQDQYYQNEGGTLVSVGANKAQGALADSAVQPTDSIDILADVDISTTAPTDGQALIWDNAGGKFVPGEAGLVDSVNTQTGDVVLNTDDIGEGTTNLYSQWDNATGGINYAGGFVGIGATDPVSLLNVKSPLLNTAETVASFGNSTIPDGLEINTNGNLDWGFNAKNSRNLTFSTNQNERMRIDSDGRVGIGTTLPEANLHIKGNVNTELRIEDQGEYVSLLYNDNGSTISVGVLNADYGNTSVADTELRIGVDGASRYATKADGSHTFYQTNGSTESMRIDSDGNVGIGTSDPEAKLSIVGTNTAGGIKIVDSSTSATSPGIEVIAKRGNTNNSTCFSGKLLLSRNRTEAAIVANNQLGSVSFGGNHTDGTEANILYSAALIGVADGAFNDASDMPTALAFFTGSTGWSPDTANTSPGTERVRITSGGLVGIGLTNPGEKLEVNGTIKATDINFTGLATYADDAAAGTGGLVAGDVYKTSTGELRIKL